MEPPETDSPSRSAVQESDLRLDGASPLEIRRERIDAPADRVWAAVRRAADAWGAEWEPRAAGGGGTGRLRLPVSAGLRYGVVDAEVSVEPVAGSRTESGGEHGEEITEVAFRPTSSLYMVNTTLLVILGFSAVGGLLVVIWPFFPEGGLAQVAPLGAVLAVVGWFLVVSRLENRGPEEFFELLALEAQKEPRDGESRGSAGEGDME